MKEIESFRIGFPTDGSIGIFFVRVNDALGWYTYAADQYHSNSVGIAENADDAAVQDALNALADDAANYLTPIIRPELQPVEQQDARNAAITEYAAALKSSIAERYIH